jgi:hypothetical protein
MTIFAPSHGAHSCAKILFAVGEKDERAKMAANEFIHDYFTWRFLRFRSIMFVLSLIFYRENGEKSVAIGTQNPRFYWVF